MTESTKIDYVSIVQDLRDEADLCRNETATDIADLLDDAASCIVAMKSQFTALRSDLAAAQEALRKQGQSALMGMDAAKAIASHNLESAKALNAQSNPAALDEARALNERLTNELEAAQEARQRAEDELGRYMMANNTLADRAQRAEALAESYRKALDNIETGLRKAGASLPAPEITGTIEGSMNTGMCIALCLVVTEREAIVGEKP